MNQGRENQWQYLNLIHEIKYFHEHLGERQDLR